MPLNESSRKTKERWPLAFDLEGIPRDNAERKRLLALQQPVEVEPMSPENFFTVSQPEAETVTDINNPPHNRHYNPFDPKNEFPKMLYHHESGHVLTVSSKVEEKAALTKGFQAKPAADRDYSKVKHGHLAPPRDATPNPSVPAEVLPSLSDEEMEAAEQELANAQNEPPALAEPEVRTARKNRK